MLIGRPRLPIRAFMTALIAGALLLSTAPSHASNITKVKYGSTIRVSVTNNSSNTIWLTPYGSTTLAPGWDIVSAHLTCLAPGRTKTMDLYFPAATAINIAQVKFQAEPADATCRNPVANVWSEKCTKNEATLSIAFEGNARRGRNGFSFTPFRGC